MATAFEMVKTSEYNKCAEFKKIIGTFMESRVVYLMHIVGLST